MTKVALFVKHQTQPGKRDEVRKVLERNMQHNIASNPGHEAYFYCFDNSDPDSICAFQQYVDLQSSQDFLRTESYAAYLKEVEPLLAGPPQVTIYYPSVDQGCRPIRAKIGIVTLPSRNARCYV